MSSSSSSIHTGTLKGDTTPRIVGQNNRLSSEYDRRLLTYEREFDVGISRMIQRREKGSDENMLAYTEKMRKITHARMNLDRDLYSPDDVPLVVRAKHIPKFPVSKSKPRRPASFDELIGKPKSKRDKPKSASRLSLPTLPDKFGRGSHHVKISFVSASDLYEIVDFSIRNKANKEETLKYLKIEKDTHRSRKPTLYNRPHAALHPREAFVKTTQDNDASKTVDAFNAYSSLPPIKGKEENDSKDSDISEEIDNELKNTTELGKSAPDALKRRPNRAKRMQLNKPELRSIPEDDIASSRKSGKSDRTIPSPPPKQSPRNVINMASQLVSIPENDQSNQSESASPSLEKKKISKLTRKDHIVTAMVKLDPFSSNNRHLDVIEPEPHLKAKLKAQKRFRKLIFLRDIPDRNNRV